MDKRLLLDLQKRTAETLDQIKAIALTQSRFSNGGDVLAGEIEKLENLHKELLGRLSEQFHQIDYLEQREPRRVCRRPFSLREWTYDREEAKTKLFA